jgi:hypothetical protein
MQHSISTEMGNKEEDYRYSSSHEYPTDLEDPE